MECVACSNHRIGLLILVLVMFYCIGSPDGIVAQEGQFPLQIESRSQEIPLELMTAVIGGDTHLVGHLKARKRGVVGDDMLHPRKSIAAVITGYIVFEGVEMQVAELEGCPVYFLRSRV